MDYSRRTAGYFVILLLNLQFAYADNLRPPLKIGMIVPLTGPAGDFGTAVKNSAMWGAEISDSSPSLVEWHIEDVTLNAAAAVTAFHKLVEVDRVDAVYVWGASLCSALADLAERSKVPLLAQCVLEQMSRDRSFVMRFMYGTSDIMTATAKVLKDMELVHPAVVTSDAPYDDELTTTLAQVFPRIVNDGELVSIDRLSAVDTEFRPIVTRIRSRKPSALIVLLGVGRLGVFQKQFYQQQVKIPVFVANTAENPTERMVSPEGFMGAYLINTPVKEFFSKGYATKFGGENQLAFGALAYEFGRMTRKVVLACPTCRRADLLNEYKKLSPWHGEATGAAEFVDSDETGAYWRYSLLLKQIVPDGNRAIGKVVELRSVN